ncbi:MAG: hypothetical protein WD599_07500 [Balneolaceae bacterium]
MSIIFLFIDGIGLGEEAEANPLTQTNWESFEKLTDGKGLQDSGTVRNESLLFTPVDATLGVEGLPQSGTGQASLFSGINAARILGRHFGPYPHSKIKFLLEKKSLFHKLMKEGYQPHFINAYPDIFFEKMSSRNRWTCTTLMAKSAGLNLNGLMELQEGRSITAEIIQRAWRERLDLEVEKISPEQAGERLLSVAESYDLVMYEYFLTDKAGHSMDMKMSNRVLSILNRFLNHIIEGKERETTLVLCSDHGNLENLSVKTHTRNPVPLIVFGPKAHRIKRADSITDVPGIILQLLK